MVVQAGACKRRERAWELHFPLAAERLGLLAAALTPAQIYLGMTKRIAALQMPSIRLRPPSSTAQPWQSTARRCAWCWRVAAGARCCCGCAASTTSRRWRGRSAWRRRHRASELAELWRLCCAVVPEMRGSCAVWVSSLSSLSRPKSSGKQGDAWSNRTGERSKNTASLIHKFKTSDAQQQYCTTTQQAPQPRKEVPSRLPARKSSVSFLIAVASTSSPAN